MEPNFELFFFILKKYRLEFRCCCIGALMWKLKDEKKKQNENLLNP